MPLQELISSFWSGFAVIYHLDLGILATCQCFAIYRSTRFAHAIEGRLPPWRILVTVCLVLGTIGAGTAGTYALVLAEKRVAGYSNRNAALMSWASFCLVSVSHQTFQDSFCLQFIKVHCDG